MSRCPDCGSEFICGMSDRNDGAPCWCSDLPALLPVPHEESKLAGCFCPQCLKRRVEATGAGGSE